MLDLNTELQCLESFMWALGKGKKRATLSVAQVFVGAHRCAPLVDGALPIVSLRFRFAFLRHRRLRF